MPAKRPTVSKARTKAPPRPRKLFYRIQDVAEITGLKPYVLRYWETQFDELAPQKDKSDQRRYRQSDIDIILKIKDLLYNQKFTIAGARQKIKSARKSGGAKVGQKSVRPTTLRGIRAELSDLMNRLGA